MKLWEQNQIKIKVAVTRHQEGQPKNKKAIFGNLTEAMHRLGYDVNEVKLNFKESKDIGDIHHKEKMNDYLTTLKNTLVRGETYKTPLFLREAVQNIEEKLIEQEVHGLFVPPTPTSTLFSSMVIPIASGFKKVATADGLFEFSNKFSELCYEAAMILAARNLKIPVFGSCHGAQLLWYMHGGELHSLPDYSTTIKKNIHRGRGWFSTDPTKFRIEDGCIKNTNHTVSGKYSTLLDTVYKEDEGYQSDSEEEKDKDYDHNLLMVVSKDKWTMYNAKKHANMKDDDTFYFPPLHARDQKIEPPKLEKNLMVARSFKFEGCVGTQWHPHKNVNTKSSIHYLHQFGQRCNAYKASITVKIKSSDLQQKGY